MKKFLAAAIFTLMLFVESLAYAMPVQLYDHNVDYVITDLKAVGKELGIDIWGTEYYTYQGARRCELNFGRSKDNVIRFRLNNDNSIVRVLVTVPVRVLFRANSEAFEQAGSVTGMILNFVGLTSSEVRSLCFTTLDDFYDALERNPNLTNYHEKHSIWCPRTRRYVVLDVERSTSSLDFYLYAHD